MKQKSGLPRLSSKALLTLLWLGFGAPSQAGDIQQKNLCFFSLNNVREFEVTRSFLDDAHKPGQNPVRSVEFHDPGLDADPESSFRKMLESGQVCDGLVISGHHTGSFGGKRAQGVLNIGFLEQLSCDARYSDFFQQVQAVWLQGCRTLGVGPVEPGANEPDELRADYHMQRVGAELIQDGLEQSFSDLSMEFSATLDQDNPLASRYARVFPAASVFGWTRTSPGEITGSERSLLYHMAHMSKLSQGTPLVDPLAKSDPDLTANMSASLWELLAGNASYAPSARAAWLNHGRVREFGVGYDNPDLNAYPPLQYSSRQALLDAGRLGCELRTSADFSALQGTLTTILASRESVAYNFNTIWEVFLDRRKLEPAEHEILRGQLVASAPLVSLLNSKLKSPRTGLLMKIEYYSFYRQLTGNRVTAVERLILDRVRHFLLARDLAGSGYDIRDFRESLLESVTRHEIADTGFYRDLIRLPEVQADTLYILAWSFVKQSPAGAGLIIDDIISHSRAESGSLRAAAIWVMTHDPGDASRLLPRIVAHPEVDEATLGTVATVLAEHDHDESEQLVGDIVAHPEAGAFALNQVSLAIRKYDIEIDKSLLDDLLSHPALDRWGLQNVARIMAGHPQLGSSDSLRRIVDHERVEAEALTSVAIALGKEGYDGESVLLQTILNHPKADARTQKYARRAMARNELQSESRSY